MKFGIQGVMFAIAITALLAGGFFLCQKENVLRRDLVQDTDKKQRVLNDLDASMAGISDANHKIAELQQAVNFFESKLPQAKEVDSVLKEVWQRAESNSLQIKTIKTPKAKRGAKYSEQAMEMSLSGNFNGFYTFLLQLEKLPRLTRVQKMALTKINEHDGDMQAEMTLTIYFEPDPDAAATASAAQ
jgi:type IV pilus assembly protein PilO